MQQESSVKVWDIGVRLFHWSLVALFLVAYLSGEGEEEGSSAEIHAWAGYIIIGLLIFRIVWGLIGSRHARFSDFVYRPSTIIAYLKSMLAGQPRHYLGHNPAGGAMVIMMLIALAAISWTGLKAYQAEGKGPLAATVEIVPVAAAEEEWGEYGEHEGNESEEFWEEAHEAAVNFTLLLIVLHLGGIVASSLLSRENLARAMITGRKRNPDA
jgi:cytochrome b